MIKQFNCRIDKIQEVATETFSFELEGISDLDKIVPGQFFHIKCSNNSTHLLRRPISICDVDHINKRVTIIFKVVGDGTRLLSNKKKGDFLDILGPLGKGFDLQLNSSMKRAYLVGGGIGVPPLYYLGKKLRDHGIEVVSLLGFGKREEIILADQFSKLGDVTISTLDGSFGQKGFVTDLLSKNELSKEELLFTCGPTPMLKALQNKFTKVTENAFMSLEQRMGCGIGACLACVCLENPEIAKNSYLKICCDGPVFNLHQMEL